MKKSELLENVMSILDTHKVKNEKLRNELAELLGPKSGGKTREFPNILNEDGSIKEKYCLTFKEYRPIEEFNLNKRSPDGYHYEVKIAEAFARYWSAQQRKVQNEINAIMEKIIEGELDVAEGKETIELMKKEIEAFKAKRAEKAHVDEETLKAARMKW